LAVNFIRISIGSFQKDDIFPKTVHRISFKDLVSYIDVVEDNNCSSGEGFELFLMLLAFGLGFIEFLL